MTTKIGTITFGQISNVRKSGDEEDVYFADVEFSQADGFPMETYLYCARANDYALTGKWVYQQIIEGNIVGTISQLAAGVDPETGEPYPDPVQATTSGSQDL
jgi:hypothetical protein